MHTIIWFQNFKRRDCLRDVGMYAIVIVNWVTEKHAVRVLAGFSLFPDRVNGLN